MQLASIITSASLQILRNVKLFLIIYMYIHFCFQKFGVSSIYMCIWNAFQVFWSQNSLSQALQIMAACWIFWIWNCFLMVAPMWKQWEEIASECSGGDRETATRQLILSTWRTIRSEVTDGTNSNLRPRTMTLEKSSLQYSGINTHVRLYVRYSKSKPYNQIIQQFYRNIWNSRMLF